MIQNSQKPLVLVTNDDGVQSPGLESLVNTLSEWAEVWVVAPMSERSAMSMALTVATPIQTKILAKNKMAISGTPADCVIVGVTQFLPRKPDYVFSGINIGGNIGKDTLYSGTVGAAIEAASNFGIQAISVSCENFAKIENDDFFNQKHYDFSACCEALKRLYRANAFDSFTNGKVLNVNAPSGPSGSLKGIKCATEGKNIGYDHALDLAENHRGSKYFWLNGVRKTGNGETQNEYELMKSGYASISVVNPSFFDSKATTDFEAIISAT